MIAAAVVMLASAGCGSGSDGPRRVPVSGTVFLGDKPLPDVTVAFYPEKGGRPSTGIANSEGKFFLSTLEPHDGTVVGPHKVSVTEPDAESLMPGMQGYGKNKQPMVVDPKYGEPQSSGLTASVGEKGEKAVEIRLEPRAKK